MSRPPPLGGLAETVLDPGDHICALYSGPQERDAMLAPYLHAGLAAGAKCMCIIEAAEQTNLLDSVRRGGGVDVDDCIDRGQLELFTAADSYLRSSTFSSQGMVRFWTDSLDETFGPAGYEVAHIAGDTSGLGDAVADDFAEFAVYESELNRLAERYPQTVLCLYDVRQVGGGMVVELLRTHRKVLLGGLVLENPHYLSPDEYVATRRVRAWAALTDGERRIADLAAQGLSTAEIAVRAEQERFIIDKDLHRIFRTLGLSSRQELVRFVTERRSSE